MNFTEFSHHNSALALFPSVCGVGWMVFDGPLSPVDWGVSKEADSARGAGNKNARSLKRIGELMDQYRPPVVVLEEFEGKTTKRRERIRQLSRSIISLCAVNGVQVHVVSRAEVRACLASSNARTRHEIAQVVASYFPEIRRLMPTKRKAWQTEPKVMALFNATALLIAHYANSRVQR
jgi:hypothetical protein